MKLTTTTTATLAIAMLFAAPANATENVIELAVDSAELASEEGTKRVLNRIKSASNRACYASPIVPPKQVRECRQAVAEELITKVDQQLNDERFVQKAIAAGMLRPAQNG